MRISVGLPLYDGKMDHRVAACLLVEVLVARENGDELSIYMLGGCSDLARGRNQIVHEFLQSDADRLVFLDSDITFKPGDLVKIAHFPEDVVGGAYRLKDDKSESYPIAFLQDRKELWANEHGLLEVQMVPTGFLSLSRDAFNRFRDGYPGREYQSRGVTQYCYFQIPYCDGALYTEDSYFCREWTALGEKVFLYPELELTHWNGNIPYTGHIGRWLRARIGAPVESQGEEGKCRNQRKKSMKSSTKTAIRRCDTSQVLPHADMNPRS